MCECAVLVSCCTVGASSASALTQCGTASWYEAKGLLTAAHRSLPLGSFVLVENLDNGRTTTVEINDRGPFVARRIIDLSRAAAQALDLIGRRLAHLRVSTAGAPKSSMPTKCVGRLLEIGIMPATRRKSPTSNSRMTAPIVAATMFACMKLRVELEAGCQETRNSGSHNSNYDISNKSEP